MKRFMIVVAVLACAAVLSAGNVTYTPDNTTIFKNPERGFTEELSGVVSASNPNVVKGEISSNWGKTEKMTLVVVLYNFNSFKKKDLPEQVLSGFDEDMAVLRNYGLKCVLRFAYTEEESDKVDAKPQWVQRHLEQLHSHLVANADVIYVLEAGFVGVWGEWYYTSNYGNESQHMNTNRHLVIQYLFANAPTDRFILFRYPMIKAEYLNDYTPLTAAEAFQNTEKARMGCHNDAFLNNYGNHGTYVSWDESLDDDPAVRQYIADETLYVPNGGETNVESSTTAKKVYTQAPAEMSTYHWSFCGKSYATAVTSRWRETGIFDTLNVHMGYRYNLLDAQFSDEAAPAGKMNVTIRVRNVGYAPIYNERTAYIVLQSSTKTYKLPLASDPRRWLPNGVITWINEQVDIPSDVPEGTYHLYLYMPDKYSSIAADPRYAVRFANVNVWDANTGYNDLGTTVTISNSAPLNPGPLPEGLEETEQAHLKPKKVVENGIFYILMPNGKKYYCI